MTAVPWIVRVGCLCAIAVLPRPAGAQMPPPAPAAGSPQPQEPATRPVRPLFGGGLGTFNQSLTVGLSFGSAFDSERAKDPLVFNATSFTSRGQSAFGNASLSYSADAGRFSAGASVRSAGFYFRRFNTGLRLSSGATAHGSVRLWRGSSASATHDLTYAPYHLTFSPAELLEQQSNPNFDPSTLIQSSFNQRTSVDFAQPIPLTRRWSAGLAYGYFIQNRGRWGHHQHAASVSLGVGLARGVGARVGYQYAVGQSKAAGVRSQWTDVHNLDAGVDFGRRLSLWRRLTFSFRTGFATITNGVASQYSLTGGARMTWTISRSWSASTGFSRHAQFIDDLSAAGIANTVNVGVGGALTRRLSLHGSVGNTSFDSALGAGDHRVKARTASLGLNASITALVSAGVSYSNGYYLFGPDVALFPGVPRERHRQAVQVRVSVFAPLYVMTRRE